MFKGQAVQGKLLETRNVTLSVTEGTGTLFSYVTGLLTTAVRRKARSYCVSGYSAPYVAVFDTLLAGPKHLAAARTNLR
jgi:hypothetical protein